MNTQQAYIEGFVKRANEYGFTDNQAIELLKQADPSDRSENVRRALALQDAKANVPLQTMFGSSLPGLAYNAYKDHTNRHTLDRNDPTMLKEMILKHLGGAALGGLTLGGGSALASYLANGQVDPNITTAGTLGGAGLGGLIGSYKGAKGYNEAIDRKLDQL